MPEEFIAEATGMDLFRVTWDGEEYVIAGNGLFVTMPRELWEKVYVAGSVAAVQPEVE